MNLTLGALFSVGSREQRRWQTEGVFGVEVCDTNVPSSQTPSTQRVEELTTTGGSHSCLDEPASAA